MNASNIDPKNPPAVYEWTGPTGVKFRDVREPSGTYYHDTTPRAVINALESAYNSGERVRLWYGDSVTGKNWLDENDVCGTVGRSTGWLKTALLIPNRRSMAGGAILADCIVCLRVGGREVYRHPGFTMPQISLRLNSEAEVAAYPWEAVVAGSGVAARFSTKPKAERWAQFMTGERNSK